MQRVVTETVNENNFDDPSIRCLSHQRKQGDIPQLKSHQLSILLRAQAPMSAQVRKILCPADVSVADLIFYPYVRELSGLTMAAPEFAGKRDQRLIRINTGTGSEERQQPAQRRVVQCVSWSIDELGGR
jgi:hypothetical protein